MVLDLMIAIAEVESELESLYSILSGTSDSVRHNSISGLIIELEELLSYLRSAYEANLSLSNERAKAEQRRLKEEYNRVVSEENRLRRQEMNRYRDYGR